MFRPEKKSFKAKKSIGKSVDWVVKKKERMRKQGKAVKTDSKFTGRKRPSAF
jgi:18S rRNA (guanine1575-N7)-methyltransferase